MGCFRQDSYAKLRMERLPTRLHYHQLAAVPSQLDCFWWIVHLSVGCHYWFTSSLWTSRICRCLIESICLHPGRRYKYRFYVQKPNFRQWFQCLDSRNCWRYVVRFEAITQNFSRYLYARRIKEFGGSIDYIFIALPAIQRISEISLLQCIEVSYDTGNQGNREDETLAKLFQFRNQCSTRSLSNRIRESIELFKSVRTLMVSSESLDIKFESKHPVGLQLKNSRICHICLKIILTYHCYHYVSNDYAGSILYIGRAKAAGNARTILIALFVCFVTNIYRFGLRQQNGYLNSTFASICFTIWCTVPYL